MADAKRTIDLVFNGIDNTGRATQSALGNVNKFAGDLGSATQPFVDVTKKALALETALISAGAVVTSFAIKAAGDFDTAFREVATLIDAPIESLDNFRQSILDYANSSTASLGQVTGAVYNAISAGVDYTKSLQTITAAEQLSVAGKGELDSTLRLLVGTLNAYGLEYEQAGNLSDKFFRSVQLGQITLPELNASLQNVTSTAASLNVPIDEVLASLVALTKANIPVTDAVTSINSTLAAFLKPTVDAEKAAKELNVQFNASAVQSKGFQQALTDVFEATEGNTEALARFFPNVRSLRAVLPLAGAAAEDFAESLTEIEQSSGVTEIAFETLAAGFQANVDKLASSFEVLQVALGAPLLESFGDVTTAIGEVFNALTGSFKEGDFKVITDFISGEFENLAEVLQGVAAALPDALGEADLSGFTDGLAAVRDAIQSLFGGLDLTAADDLKRAIEFVGDSFNGLSQFAAGAIESFGPLFQFFADLADKANDSGDALRDVGTAFGFASQLNLFSDALGGVTNVLDLFVGVLIANAGINAVVGVSRFVGLLFMPQGLIAGLTILAGFGSFKIFEQLNKLPEEFDGERLSTHLADIAAKLTGLAQQANELESVEVFPFLRDDLDLNQYTNLQTVLENIGETNTAGLENYVEKLGQLTNLVERAAASDPSETFGEIIDPQDFARLKEAGIVYRDADGNLREYIATLQLLPDEIQPSAKALKALGDESAGTFNVIKNDAVKAKDSLELLTDASDELRASVLEAMIAAQASINVAQIQADADVAVAAFEAVANSITNTGDVLTELYGLLGDDGLRKLDKIDLREQIKEEAKLREEAFALQKRQVEEQLKYLRERTKALKNGGSLITVKGDGLQPHLEAIWYEILEALQVRVTQDGEEFLLGLS